jgi:hypothetical protein
MLDPLSSYDIGATIRIETLNYFSWLLRSTIAGLANRRLWHRDRTSRTT